MELGQHIFLAVESGRQFMRSWRLVEENGLDQLDCLLAG